VENKPHPNHILEKRGLNCVGRETRKETVHCEKKKAKEQSMRKLKVQWKSKLAKSIHSMSYKRRLPYPDPVCISIASTLLLRNSSATVFKSLT
jgi:hypothetical protein